MANTNQNVLDFFEFIKSSPTAFHASESVARKLDSEGFTRISLCDSLSLTAGGKYYILKNSSSIIAFILPSAATPPVSYSICASHSDSPTFKLKDNFELDAFGKYTKLDTERYGGPIFSSWFDRPLSVAGRVVYDCGNSCESALVMSDDDLLLIPNLAIHMNRSINDGYAYNLQVDTLPLYGSGDCKGSLLKALTEKSECVLSHDLYLYCREKGILWGANREFISAPRIDNLECAYTTLCGFIASEENKGVKIYAMFDNEETGSLTKQGADSSFLSDVISLINYSMGGDEASLRRALANSFMVSADNAHAKHPNHPEYADPVNAPNMNEGIVIKFNASQRYTSDAMSASFIKLICKRANVPYQTYANRSDIPGGSTLGAIADSHVSVATADIGLAQLAMHSAYETAGALDVNYMIKFAKEFFSASISFTDTTITVE